MGGQKLDQKLPLGPSLNQAEAGHFWIETATGTKMLVGSQSQWGQPEVLPLNDLCCLSASEFLCPQRASHQVIRGSSRASFQIQIMSSDTQGLVVARGTSAPLLLSWIPGPPRCIPPHPTPATRLELCPSKNRCFQVWTEKHGTHRPGQACGAKTQSHRSWMMSNSGECCSKTRGYSFARGQCCVHCPRSIARKNQTS